MNILACFGSGQSRPSTTPSSTRARRSTFDPSKGARVVRPGPLPAAPPAAAAPPRAALAQKRPSVLSSRPNSAPSPSPSSSTPARSQAQAQVPAQSGSQRREDNSQAQRSQYNKDNMRRPSAVGSGSYGQANDPFACTHLTELMPITPIESTYRAHSGGTLPDGIEAPESREQNMRRLYVHDEDRVLLKVVHYGNPTSVGIEFEEGGDWQFKPLWTQRAGPRAQIYFHPSAVKAAIVTCGGLCPGLNDVIRQVVFTLDVYGVKEILGIQYGFKGFVDPKYPPVALTRKLVSRVHMAGGSFLGVSRGTPDLNDIVDKLQDWGINFFFIIGGNGSHAGAHEIYKRCLERKMKIAVVGIPKTIDNDLQLVDKTFGFDTSVEEAQRAINAAFVEASSAYNGVGIVKLMGRQSGFIAMYATLASGQVDIVLIPEVPFVLEGEHGVYNFMKKRLDKNGLCVVVIAEGAGQELLESSGGVDASGNPILGDIGKWFYSQVKAYFGKIKMSVDVKYIDPTYMIRARHCNSSDHIICSVLGQNAVHGAFAGYTDITIGLVNTHYVFLPIPKVIEVARKVDPNSNMWHRTVTSTGQPDFPMVPQKISEKKAQSQPSSPPKSQPTSPKSPVSGSSRSQSPGDPYLAGAIHLI
ncbi:hypothetical protein Mp_1g27810 [Marchantia polymorpha subsp. ruderalis]|uniref:Phosphofructokinase domain-containing protein n=2 Tax=Marchantia polymorpha TaxID=3197 RepID=A0AAF6AV04_MARPO|nr:hypothetical protein MARPO_0002s0097 [Marchantia polymorpha]BBN00273.1 hypothetical protein Mp_1g27810 [Marchantia polymorpha subsp. ruderalis]PTQ49610.1 hypothetical protein MARPO_0002s0097 [Marchantia polymorpha]PTQ49611.1 hypothetical protein MARPO_0002s0097 [Marchantia polymorpha]BBN00274.1 hypothetical protein Mp_1g27810 [Marchantia polymorpha subsp. ruderalis]|eukprot:PTQ49603.1 hypothetical protein MARPO_0002s0097 [Marchantia polymorpha]